MKMQVFCAEQKGVKLYIGVLPARVLVDGEKTKVDGWAAAHPQGYQRQLVPKRISEVAGYLMREEGIFPTSVLLSVRSKEVLFEETARLDGVVLGVLELPDAEPLWLIDGQHRVAGLKSAIEKGETAFENYPIPVTLLVNPDPFNEMRFFYLVNSRAKSVPTDIADRLLQRMLSERGALKFYEWQPQQPREAEKKVLQARATNVTDYLRANCPVWKSRVAVPGEPRPSRYAIRQHTLVGSLLFGPFKDPTLCRYSDSDIGLLLDRYWQALKRVFPEAFDAPDEYSIMITPGVFSLHAIFPDVFERCREVRDYSENKMAEIVNATGLGSDFWSKKEDVGNPLTFGGSLKSLTVLSNYLRSLLSKLALAGM